MVSTASLDDRVIPYHPIEHRDTIHISKKRYFPPLFYSKDINSYNQARDHLWQETYVYLPKIPQPNLSVKRVPLPNFLIEGR